MSNLDLDRVQMSDTEFDDFLSCADTSDLKSYLDALHRVISNWREIGDRLYHETANRAAQVRTAISEDLQEQFANQD